ncbi:MAG: RNA-binding RBP37 [Trebouxia sp. A1-2]|nr:MAG: RNA-binding RBP37 [Trebouxia sp. A1-2]
MPQQTDRTIYVGSVGKEVDEPALLALFGHCGTVTQIRIAGDPSYDTRYAFIEFTAPEEAQVALLLDGMAVFNRTIKVSMARGGAGPGVVRSNDPDRVQRTVHVGGLPMEELSETVLADFFQNVGEVLAVRKSGRFAWVEFTSIQAAHQALTLDGGLLGANMLKISQSKTPIHTAGWRAPPKGQAPSRPDLMTLAAQRIQQPLSPSLLGRGPSLAAPSFAPFPIWQQPASLYSHQTDSLNTSQLRPIFPPNQMLLPDPYQQKAMNAQEFSLPHDASFAYSQPYATGTEGNRKDPSIVGKA